MFFQATNGVKQGSIISPILFTVYVDELIARLQASGLGCNIGRSYIGVLGYADDLTLLSPSSSSSSSIYFNSTTSISQYSNKCIQYRHNGKLNTFLDIR